MEICKFGVNDRSFQAVGPNILRMVRESENERAKMKEEMNGGLGVRV